MLTFETERLILRPWRKSDLGDFYEYAKDPEVGPNAGWKPHENMDESRRILQSFIDGEEVRAVVLKQTGKVIGSLGLHPDRLRHEGMGEGREIGYVLSHKFWGRGLMPEAVRGAIRFAFETMRLDYLAVAHFPSNARSRRVIEKCGFRYEKILSASFPDYAGIKQDELCYILTSKEYQSEKPKGPFHTALLTRDQAAEIGSWKYPGRFAVYEWTLPDDAEFRAQFFAVLNAQGAFCGYYRFFPENGGIMLGLGIKPEFCGHGYGKDVMALILKDFRQKYPGKTLELEVREWNARAIACYRRAGFRGIGSCRRETPSGGDAFLRMQYTGPEIEPL